MRPSGGAVNQGVIDASASAGYRVILWSGSAGDGSASTTPADMVKNVLAVAKPGDTILAMSLNFGGHLTHGSPVNFSGKFFEIVHYGVRKEDERIDYDQLAQMAREHQPKMITVGASAYPRMIDFPAVRKVAKLEVA